jgi:hypothetical protein
MHIGPRKTYDGKIPFVDVVEIEFQAPGKDNSVSNPPDVSIGTPSLFNQYAMVVFPSLGPATVGAASLYNQVIDGGSPAPGANGGNTFSPKFNQSIPSISMLVEDSDNILSNKTPYNYTDFLYCKYVGKIPNNQLITLRRYPAPTFDNLAVPGQNPGDPKEGIKAGMTIAEVDTQPEFFPIAQAVTWFGEETGNKLSELLSFGVSMNWKLIESEVNTAAGNEQGSEDSPAPAVAQFLGILTGQVNTPFATANSQYDPYNGGPYSHRVYGPVNVIEKTYKRDRGLDYKQSMTINFEYELKSIGSINPKAAMLDLMSNMLALTYNNAAFWGGANRYFPQKPTYPFLGGKEGMNAWYRGEPAQFAKAVGKQMMGAGSAIADTLAKLAEDPIGELKRLAGGAAKLGMIQMGKGRAPAIVAMKALLTGEPIGEWHMVIGNPYKPIAKIGNLICTESKFQFNDIIGADNFPTELKVSITVEHGRPRDAGDIQSMFNEGQGRIYYPPKGLGEVLNASSSTENSRNDTSWKTGSAAPYARDTKTVGLFTGSSSDFDSLVGSIKNTKTGLTETGKTAWNLADKMFLRTAGSRK